MSDLRQSPLGLGETSWLFRSLLLYSLSYWRESLSRGGRVVIWSFNGNGLRINCVNSFSGSSIPRVKSKDGNWRTEPPWDLFFGNEKYHGMRHKALHFANISRNNVQARAHEEKGSPVLKEVKALVKRDWPEISYLCPSQSIEGETFAACKKLKPTFSPFAHGSAGIRRAKLVF